MIVLMLLFLIGFVWLDLTYFSCPYIWAGLVSGSCLLAYGLRTGRSWGKLLSINAGVFLVIIGLLEAGVTVFAPPQDRWVYSRDYYHFHDFLGHAPPPNATVSCQHYRGQRLMYDAVYTIDKNGLRITPPCEGAGCNQSILFFGCSFTFGEGLNDDQTLPYIVGTLTKNRVYNFGFQAYGPHQMLSAIDHGLLERVVEATPKYAIYQAGFFHVERAAGRYQWDNHGPKYVLRGDNGVRFVGHFDDSPQKRFVDHLLAKSAVYENFIATRSWVTKKDIRLFIAIVTAAKNELVAKYPGLEFHVIYWGPAAPDDDMILEALRKQGIKVHYLRDILVPKTDDWHKEFLQPDGHPNYDANQTFADYIVRHIMHKPVTP